MPSAENILLLVIPIGILLVLGLAWLITEHGPVQLSIRGLTLLRASVILVSMLAPEIVRKARYWWPDALKIAKGEL